MKTPDPPSPNAGRRFNRREPSLNTILALRARHRAQTIRNASQYGSSPPSPARPPLFVVVRVHQPGTVILTLSGQINTVTAPLITAAITQHLAGAPERVIIDLAGITVLTPTGISQLVEAQRGGEALKFTLLLAAPSDVVLQALTTSEIIERFVIHSTIDDALRA